jgi:hypothetical protein
MRKRILHISTSLNNMLIIHIVQSRVTYNYVNPFNIFDLYVITIARVWSSVKKGEKISTLYIYIITYYCKFTVHITRN